MASKKALIESELLVLQHRRGDSEALDRLVAVWERPLYYYIRRLVNSDDEAKDIAQDVWLKVFRKLRRLRDPASFPAWLYRIARNDVVSHFRAPPAHAPLPDDDTIVAQDEHLPAMNAESLHWGLGQLSPLHSESVMLHYLEGFSLEEVSGIVDAPIGTVKSRIHYAKRVLRTLLSEEARDHEQ